MNLIGIPMPPSLNNAYPTNRFGKRFKSSEYRYWEREFNMWAFLNNKVIKEAYLRFSNNKKIRLSVSCIYKFHKSRIVCLNGDNKKLDLDNRMKPLLDALGPALGFDDSYIWRLLLIKEVGEQDQCDVWLEEIQ